MAIKYNIFIWKINNELLFNIYIDIVIVNTLKYVFYIYILLFYKLFIMWC